MSDTSINKIPRNIELLDHGTHIEIIRKWFAPTTVLMTLCALFVITFAVLGYLGVEDIEAPSEEGMLFFIGLGLLFTYGALTGWFNRTHISVSQSEIVIRHVPIPAFGNKTVAVHEIKHVYAAGNIRPLSNTFISYRIRAITHSGRDILLLHNLLEREETLYIEQQIKKYLKIKDVPLKVKGQIR